MEKQPKSNPSSSPAHPAKRILAVIGATALVILYLSTLFCALSESEHFMDFLMASIYATVIIPVLLWAYTFIYRLIKKNSE